jgi:hypothetical protein
MINIIGWIIVAFFIVGIIAVGFASPRGMPSQTSQRESIGETVIAFVIVLFWPWILPILWMLISVRFGGIAE